MTERSSRRVLLYLGLGFIALAALLWINDALDAPYHLFRGVRSAHRVEEILLEVALVLLLGGLVMTWARRTVRRVDYLERFVKLCSWCRRVQLDDEWLRIEAYLAKHDKETSHSMCPECAERFLEANAPAKPPS